MSHALLSPSAAGRWVACPASIFMCQKYPEKQSSEAAEEGTATHWIGSTALEGKPMPAVGVTAPNGVITTIEMVECAGVYVAAALPDAQGASMYAVEQHMVCGDIHHECHGTPDLWYWHADRMELHVWDYKHGFRIVEAVENWQLMTYAIGALRAVANQYGWGADCFRADIQIVLHIVQPRPFHAQGPVRQWRITAAQLGMFCITLRGAAAAAMAAMNGNGQTCTGAQCVYCSGRVGCPALQHAALAAVDYSMTATPCDLSTDALAMELRILQRCADLVKARLTGLEQQALGVIQTGGTVPGFAMDHGKGRAIWSRPVSEVIMLGQMLGVNLAAPQEAVTPAQAKKMGLDAEILAAYSETPTTGLKLVRSDKSAAALAFKSH